MSGFSFFSGPAVPVFFASSAWRLSDVGHLAEAHFLPFLIPIIR